MLPNKLKKGDKIVVIAPSRSLKIVSDNVRKVAIKTLEQIGISIQYASFVDESDEFGSSSIEMRVKNLHDAFLDSSVNGIITSIGGFNSNQLLDYIDYSIIQNNPKIICGYSDITTLNNAIYKKTGLVTYLGPHFSTFGMIKGLEYTLRYFTSCVMNSNQYVIKSSDEWSDDLWFENQSERKFYKNSGYKIINFGNAEGVIIGGNLSSFNLLHGTQYMPSLENSILIIEDCSLSSPEIFDRQLQALIHQPSFELVKGIIIGRFQLMSRMSEQKLYKIIKSKKALSKIPVLVNVDIGHTTPMLTLPIGGRARIECNSDNVIFEIDEH